MKIYTVIFSLYTHYTLHSVKMRATGMYLYHGEYFPLWDVDFNEFDASVFFPEVPDFIVVESKHLEKFKIVNCRHLKHEGAIEIDVRDLLF